MMLWSTLAATGVPRQRAFSSHSTIIASCAQHAAPKGDNARVRRHSVAAILGADFWRDFSARFSGAVLRRGVGAVRVGGGGGLGAWRIQVRGQVRVRGELRCKCECQCARGRACRCARQGDAREIVAATMSET
eukprot:4550300-Pleurochrysis_carterae.AAC.2